MSDKKFNVVFQKIDTTFKPSFLERGGKFDTPDSCTDIISNEFIDGLFAGLGLDGILPEGCEAYLDEAGKLICPLPNMRNVAGIKF